MATKTFTAKNMSDAMQMVRQQLGPDAAVVNSREVTSSGAMRWIYPNRRVEVTAATEPAAGRPTPPRRHRKPTRRPVQSGSAAGTTIPNDADVVVAAGTVEAAISPDSNRSDMSLEYADLRQKLIKLNSVMKKVQQAPDQLDPASLPDELAALAQRLSAADVAGGVAMDLIDQVRSTVPESQHDNSAILSRRLVEIVAEDLTTTAGISPTPGQAYKVAVVGPAGVGKTTMIAKLAAEYQLRQKRSVALVTCDNFRVAATDQLQTYAEIIGVPFETVAAPREMREAIRRLSNCDLILIDTPGRSPGDEVKLQEVKSLLSEAEPDEVHLVQSCSSAPSHLQRCLDSFATIGITGIMLTKLDEAVPAGHLLPVMKQTNLPISYVSDGQIVPDDMQIADPLELAERFLNSI